MAVITLDDKDFLELVSVSDTANTYEWARMDGFSETILDRVATFQDPDEPLDGNKGPLGLQIVKRSPRRGIQLDGFSSSALSIVPSTRLEGGITWDELGGTIGHLYRSRNSQSIHARFNGFTSTLLDAITLAVSDGLFWCSPNYYHLLGDFIQRMDGFSTTVLTLAAYTTPQVVFGGTMFDVKEPAGWTPGTSLDVYLGEVFVPPRYYQMDGFTATVLSSKAALGITDLAIAPGCESCAWWHHWDTVIGELVCDPELEPSLSGMVNVEGSLMLDGDVEIGASLEGEVEIEGSLEGTVAIGESLEGLVAIEASLEATVGLAHEAVS